MGSSNRIASAAAPLLVAALLGACSLDSVLATCATCGEVRSIAPRQRFDEARFTGPTRATRIAAVPVVYDVRVLMDRGGSRDFTLSSLGRLRVGDRVEIRDGRVVPRPGHGDWS